MVPGEVSVDLDGRILPTFTPEALISELTAMARVDSGAAFEVLNHDAGPEKPDLSLFETLEAVLKEVDPDGLPVPMLMPAATDGRLFARLGIQTYGVLPMRLPQTWILPLRFMAQMSVYHRMQSALEQRPFIAYGRTV